MRVFVTRSLPLDPSSIAPPGIQVAVSPHERQLEPDEIAAFAAESDGIVSMLSDPFDDSLLSRLPRLKVLANYAVGVDNIDRSAASARGIVVCNTPDVLTDATADLAFTLVLALTRRIREGERLLRSGGFDGWSPNLLLGTGLAGKTMGLLGFGRIGQAVARRAIAFGMDVIYHTRHPVLDEIARSIPGANATSWPDLLARADVVSLHAPLTPRTCHLVDGAAFGAMKPGSILINTARGPLVDEGALVKALESGTIAGAGLDVFEAEPTVHPGLMGRENVVLLPHLGSATVETRTAMAKLALEGCFTALTGGTPANVAR